MLKQLRALHVQIKWEAWDQFERSQRYKEKGDEESYTHLQAVSTTKRRIADQLGEILDQAPTPQHTTLPVWTKAIEGEGWKVYLRTDIEEIRIKDQYSDESLLFTNEEAKAIALALLALTEKEEGK